MIEPVWVWIELPDEFGWGPTQALKGRLARGGYHVEVFAGTDPALIITGAVLDYHTLPAPPPRPARRHAAGTAPPAGALADPLLTRARPPERPCAGRVLAVSRAVAIQLADGSWVSAEVTGQCRDRSGRWCVRLRWQAGQHSGWFIFDPANIAKTR